MACMVDNYNNGHCVLKQSQQECEESVLTASCAQGEHSSSTSGSDASGNPNSEAESTIQDSYDSLEPPSHKTARWS